MERLDFLVLGNASSHYILKVDKIPDDDTTIYLQNSDFDTLFFGGTGLNIIYSLAKLSGCSSAILTAVDRQYGMSALDKLHEVNVDTSCVEVIEGKATAYIIEDEEKRRLTILGGQHGQITGSAMPDELFQKAKLAIFSMDFAENVNAFAQKLEKNGTPFAFCMRSDKSIFTQELLCRVVPRAKLLFCNAYEQKLLEQVLGIPHIQELFARGDAEIIAVTQGAEGIRLYERDGGKDGISIPPTQVEGEIVDCTGAGDAFCAGYLYGMIKGFSPVECAKLGATCSSFIIEKLGCITGAPTEESLLRRYYDRPDVHRGKKE